MLPSKVRPNLVSAAICRGIFCIATLAAISAQAQQTPANAPPKLEKLDEGEAPAITIRNPDASKKVTEKRQQGKVTEVKVQSGKSTYYAKPNQPAGSALPGDAQSNTNRAAQWQVMEFGKGKEGKEAAPPPALPPAAVPATSAAPVSSAPSAVPVKK
ncbi:hypothetical protein BH11PSE11_BH11PSE11_32350 [soil metagenome]